MRKGIWREDELGKRCQQNVDNSREVEMLREEKAETELIEAIKTNNNKIFANHRPCKDSELGSISEGAKWTENRKTAHKPCSRHS